MNRHGASGVVDRPVPFPALEAAPDADACRLCNTPLERIFVDLGVSPLCETYPGPDELDDMEPFYPLRVFVCETCLLVQLKEYVPPEEIFREYPYLSSSSSRWGEHAQRFAERVTRDLELGPDSLVMELASNDGYLLQHFQSAGVQVLGIEPARNAARIAEEKGISTVTEFFGRELARRLASEGHQANLIVANNVLAHVPDIHSFVEGVRTLLAPDGIVTMEFPHLLRLVEGNQFDTIYHEHFSYLSLLAVERLFGAHELRVFNVEELPTLGGSLRIHVAHAHRSELPEADGLQRVRWLELQTGMHGMGFYDGFEIRVQRVKAQLVSFLIEARRKGRRVVGYGALGKGNTLLNYCGLRSDLLEFTVDPDPVKQGRFLPGTHVPIFAPDCIREQKPDYILILPWNLKDEIVDQLSYVREWGAQFVIPIPELEIL